MRTLITGGTGYLGRALAHALLQRGEQVTLLDHYPRPVPDGARLVEGRIGDPDALRDALRGVHRVAHLAAVASEHPGECVSYNTVDTARLLEQLAHVKRRPRRLVVASDAAIYGEGEYECQWHGRLAPSPRAASRLTAGRWDPRCGRCDRKLTPVPITESCPSQPASVRAVTKLDQEQLCLLQGPHLGIPTLAVRLFSVYGPDRTDGVVGQLADRVLRGERVALYEDGRQTRDFLHRTDAVSGLVAALDSQHAGVAVNLGTGQPTSLNKLCGLISDALAAGPPADASGEARPGDARHLIANPALARRLLEWQATIPVEDGVPSAVRPVEAILA